MVVGIRVRAEDVVTGVWQEEVGEDCNRVMIAMEATKAWGIEKR